MHSRSKTVWCISSILCAVASLCRTNTVFGNSCWVLFMDSGAEDLFVLYFDQQPHGAPCQRGLRSAHVTFAFARQGLFVALVVVMKTFCRTGCHCFRKPYSWSACLHIITAEATRLSISTCHHTTSANISSVLFHLQTAHAITYSNLLRRLIQPPVCDPT